jgi:hypothetical protein
MHFAKTLVLGTLLAGVAAGGEADGEHARKACRAGAGEASSQCASEAGGPSASQASGERARKTWHQGTVEASCSSGH